MSKTGIINLQGFLYNAKVVQRSPGSSHMYSVCKIMLCFDTAYDQLKNWSVVNVGMNKKIATVCVKLEVFFFIAP